MKKSLKGSESDHPSAHLEEKDKFKILIVDDVSENLFALNALLQRDDVIIIKALSGYLALELMMLHDFCLTFIDVQMPEMNGFELAELMRGSNKTKNIPIIFVTATAKDQGFSFKGYESGAVDFLLKPLDPFAVKSKVNIFVEIFDQKMELKNQLKTITRLNADLNLSKEEAEKANSSKTQFLANMSHEIRTPLGAILGFLDLLKNPVCTVEEKANYIIIVERNSQQLLSLINDILDLSKVEAGKMTIEDIQFSLTEMLQDIKCLMTFKAKEKGIDFHFKSDSEIPEFINSDPVKLRQIITNIVGNAVKFTEKGGVNLSVSFTDPILKIIIKDTGVGISKDQVSKLFQPFTQADPSTTRKFGGTGLGLILSRRLAEALGGKLELLESHNSQGSTFEIEVKTTSVLSTKDSAVNPRKLIKTQSQNINKIGMNLCSLKVLLVEDSLDNQMLITTYLRKEGADVKTASDGQLGLTAALAEDFDVVLMDIQMPVLDGHGATKKLREANYSKPIIALTAHAMKEERIKGLASGFTDFLTKPIQRNLLIEILSQYVPITTAAEEASRINQIIR